MRKVLKIGGWTMLGGTLAVLASMAGGFGPCGPASTAGTFLFFGGMLVFAIGSITAVIGAVALI
jgi:hypothetical protein